MSVAAQADTTVGGLRRQITRRLAAELAARGADGSPELDARLILGHVLGCGPGEVVLRDAATLAPDALRRAMALANSRAAGVPLARLFGEREFWSLPFALSPETLVPRPDTETLVEAALAAIDSAGRRAEPLAILDLGTGSGAILLALLSELPAARGVGVDISEGALLTARANARRLGLGDRARFVAGDWAAAIGGRFDLVVSNPPYVPTSDIAGLPVEVRGHDPHMALDGGPDGLDAYREILRAVRGLMRPDGVALVEVGQGQAGAVAEMARESGADAMVHRDLAGIDRVVTLEWESQKRGLENRSEADIFRSP